MLFSTLGAALLGNLLTWKWIVRAGSGNKKRKGIIRACFGKQWDFWGRNTKYECILKMNQDFMVFFQEIISLKQ